MRFIVMFPILVRSVLAADGGTSRTADVQREFVARQMEASLAAQRASIALQTGGTPTTSFFLLPALQKDTIHPASPTATRSTPCAPISGQQVDALIAAAAKRVDLKPELLRSVAQQESALDPCAVSRKGAQGVMQLMPETARDLGVTDPFDPAQSIDGGARLLRKYLDMYGSLPLALGAYNAGPARVNQSGDVPPIPETLDYVRRILSVLPPGK